MAYYSKQKNKAVLQLRKGISQHHDYSIMKIINFSFCLYSLLSKYIKVNIHCVDIKMTYFEKMQAFNRYECNHSHIEQCENF